MKHISAREEDQTADTAVQPPPPAQTKKCMYWIS